MQKPEQKTLTAHEFPLRKVFSSDYEFAIPEYQRPYRWGTDQALQLLDDLEESLDRDPDEPYFLGSLVLVRRSETEYDVIDGQQRLTTLTMLFAVLRELSTGTISDELRDLILEPGSELSDIAPKPRLELRPQDKKFFEKYVQTPGHIQDLCALSDSAALSEPQRAIRDNAKALHGRLTGWEDAKRRKLATLASTRTYLVIVSTPDLNSAYRIFSVLNARGLDLSPADIFKSRVIGAIDDETDYAKRWEDAEESLGSDDFTELFRDIRTVVSGERARRELLREFPEQVLNGYLVDGRPGDFIEELLLPYAKAYERTIAHDFGPGFEWRPVNDWLKRLAMIDNKDWRPCALWALKHYPDDVQFLKEFLRRLERLAASFLLRGEYTTPRTGRYLDLLKELKNGSGLDAPSFELTAEEKTDTRRALDGAIYKMQTKRARYVLLRLDEILAKDPGVTYAQSIISIEHVLPQNPKAGSQWEADFSIEERENWTHRLGNLLLLNHRKNSQAQNYDFATKKERYFKSGSAIFALTTQVLGHDSWTPAVTEARQGELTGALFSEWSLV